MENDQDMEGLIGLVEARQMLDEIIKREFFRVSGSADPESSSSKSVLNSIRHEHPAPYIPYSGIDPLTQISDYEKNIAQAVANTFHEAADRKLVDSPYEGLQNSIFAKTSIVAHHLERLNQERIKKYAASNKHPIGWDASGNPVFRRSPA